MNHGSQYSDTDFLTKTPAEVDICCEITSERDGANFGGVGDANGLEDTPGKTAEDFGGEKHLDVLGGEEEGDAGGEPDETADDRIAVAEAFGEPAVEEETDNGTDVGTLDSCVSDHVAKIEDIGGSRTLLRPACHAADT
jgi:hypothetical protein